MRTKDIIARQWREFQQRMTAVHGHEMAKDEALMHMERLLASHRREMLESFTESWLPTEKIMLRDLVAAEEGGKLPPMRVRDTEAPKVLRSKKTAQDAISEL